MAEGDVQRFPLNDSLIRAELLHIAPMGSQLTSWNLGLDTIGCRVPPKDRGYEELLFGLPDEIGICDWQSLMLGLLERMLEYLIEQNTLAAYMPGAGEILVIQENVDDSTLDGLRIESYFNLGTLLMRLVGASKAAQYTGGLSQVAAADASGRVESLY